MSSQKTKRSRSGLLVLIAVLVIALAVLMGVAVWLSGRPDAPAGTQPSQTESKPGDPEQMVTGWQEVDGKKYYDDAHGNLLTGQQEVDGKVYFFGEDGAMQTGSVEIGGKRYLMGEEGARLGAGWQEVGGKRYLVQEDATLYTGWLEQAEGKYYFLEDGAAAVGQVEIQQQRYFFTSTGVNLVVVNPWNPVPDGYTMTLKELPTDVASSNMKVDESCYEDLVEMLRDCKQECTRVCVISSYRSISYQEGLFERRIQRFMDQGYNREEATKLAATIVAVPGTSEHHLGLAVDIIDTDLWELEEEQENMPGQIWLMENCWKYGFILRYPKGTTESTGIIYEPWHYRYVGKALAEEIHNLQMENPQLTLEDYLASLTN